MLKSRAIVAVLVSVGVWACASVRSGGGDSNGRGVATTAATRVATTITPTTSPAPTTVPIGAPLTITIKDLRNKKGNLVFGVFKSAAGFPTVESKSVYWEVRDAGADSLTFTTHLPPGRYGASVLHDENRDGKMDRGFGGLPLEGYGVTNNPKPFMRAATFKEATFDLPAAGAAKTISLQYFQ